ncbi:MAG: hypothetical protein OIF57_03110 [Marinobacterium sp.]|nr:hypothetical protein [Marinobacterium sp.]
MTDTQHSVRLIKHPGLNGDSWVCQQRFPDGTWKNRQLWKPVTRPLGKAEMIDWLSQHNDITDTASYFS